MTSRGRAFAYFLKSRSGVFVWASRPQSGIFAAFQTKKEKTNAQQMPERGSRIGMLGIDWAIIELHNDQSNSTYKYWSENMGIQRRFFGTKVDTLFLSHFPHLFLYQESWKKKQSFSREYNPSRSLGLDIFQKELFSFKYHSLSSDYFDYLCNVWIDRPLMPSSDVTTPLL